MTREEEIQLKYANIRKEDIPEFPGLLKYAHHVGSAIIRPDNMEKWREEAIVPRIAETSKTLSMLERILNVVQGIVSNENEKKEVEEQAKVEAYRAIKDLIFLDFLYTSKLYHEPARGAMYHMYKQKGELRLSLVGPTEWDVYEEYICSATYRDDKFFELQQQNEQLFLGRINKFIEEKYSS